MAQKKLTGKQMGVAAGLTAAAAAAAAAGYYFYASENAAKNRKIAAKWATDMKKEVVTQAKKAKDLNRAQMLKIIDRAAAAYETARAVDPREIARATKELRDNWQDLISSKAGQKRAPKKAASRGKSAKKRGRS